MNFSGSGQGAVEIAGTNPGAGPAAGGSRPVRRRAEYPAIFCKGLGPVAGAHGDAPPADGAGTPSYILYSTQATVSATIGGVEMPALVLGADAGNGRALPGEYTGDWISSEW